MGTIEIKDKVEVGDLVKFYDCQKAYASKDYSGANPTHYPIGEVIRVYFKKCYYSRELDYLCDIKIDDRISTAHFVSGVEIIQKKKW